MFSNKFIHIHVPKTAGQKVRGVLNEFKKDYEFFNEQSHLSLNEIKKILKEEYNINNHIFSFVFTRNPWDFYVSRFFFRKGTEKLEDIILEDFDSNLEGFQKHMFMLKDLLGENNVLDKFSHLVLTKQGTTANTRTYKFLGIEGWHNYMVDPCVDFIGRFENFSEDFFIVLKKIFLDDKPNRLLKEKCISKVNISSRENDYRKYYTTELVDLVYSWDKNYCEKFDYKFE